MAGITLPADQDPRKPDLPEGEPIQPLNNAIVIADQLHTLDGSIALVPRVHTNRREDLPWFLQRLVITNLDGAPRVVGIHGIGHRMGARINHHPQEAGQGGIGLSMLLPFIQVIISLFRITQKRLL